METKICSKCNQEKTIDEFVKDKSKKDGTRNYCKECNNLQRRKTPIKPKAKDGFKICTKCNKELRLTDFNIRTVNGEKTHFSWCKQCEQEYNNNRYVHTCSKCGKEYRSGKKHSKACKDCHVKRISEIGGKRFKTLNANQFGENNPMFGVQRFGKSNPNYNPNKTEEEREQERLVEGYGIWRMEVYKRDRFTCQCCGDKTGHNLISHHLDGWDWCKAKRLDVDNGITLCSKCHKQFHDKYGYGKNTKKQFYEFKNQTTNNMLIPR